MLLSAHATRLWHEQKQAGAADAGADANTCGWIGPVSRCVHFRRGVGSGSFRTVNPGCSLRSVGRAQLLNRERERRLQPLLGILVEFGAPDGQVENIDGDLPFRID